MLDTRLKFSPGCTRPWHLQKMNYQLKLGLVPVAVGATIGIVAYELWKWGRRRYSTKVDDTTQCGCGTNKRKLKLYHSFPFRSCRCAWLVNELQVKDEVEFIPIALHGSNPADLQRYKEDVHPHATLPALTLEDGTTMLESGAICMYLAEVFSDVSTVNMLPEGDKETANYYNYISYAIATVDQILEPLYMQLTHTPEKQRDDELVKKKMEQFDILATHLSDRLSYHQFICGDRFTTADCVIGYNMWWASVIQGGELLKKYPALEGYVDRLKERPAFQETFKGVKPVIPSGGSL